MIDAPTMTVPPQLRQTFEPSFEQLGYVARATPSGLVASAGKAGREDGPVTGAAWVAPVGPWGAVICLSQRFGRSVELEEHPLDCICIARASVSPDTPTPGYEVPPDSNSRPGRTAAANAGPRPGRPVSGGTTLAFARRAGTERYAVPAGARHESRTICLLPEFFSWVESTTGYVASCSTAGASGRLRFESLAQALPALDAEALADDLVPVFAALDPARAERPGTVFHVRAQVFEALAVLTDHAAGAACALARQGDRAQAGLAAAARAVVDSGLDRPLRLADIAGRLYVSRSYLCEAFRCETGESLGAYVRRRRMERACELLATTDLPVGEIARRVGYASQASFAGVFRRACGLAPTAWREGQR